MEGRIQPQDTKVEFSSLGELFAKSGRPALTSPPTFPDDFHPTFVPICQHNIYKYTPFTFEPVEDAEKSQDSAPLCRVVFPDTKLPLIQQLDWPWEGEPTEVKDASRYPPTCEEKGAKMLQMYFRSGDLEDLRYQLYLSHVNQYNLEQWFNPLKDVEVSGSHGKPYRVLRPSVLIDLTPEEVARIEELHEKASNGRYVPFELVTLLTRECILVDIWDPSCMISLC